MCLTVTKVAMVIICFWKRSLIWLTGLLTVQVLPPASSDATLSPLGSMVTLVSGTFSRDYREVERGEGKRYGWKDQEKERERGTREG